jgi:RNA polymerase sigma-70 factor (ECF subfamily)
MFFGRFGKSNDKPASDGGSPASLAPVTPVTPATFEEVYRAHFAMVWRTLGRLGVRESDLMDVTQNVFIIVHRQLPRFEARSEITTWLFSICRLVAKDYLRSAPIRREIVVDARELAHRSTPGDNPVHGMDKRERQRVLQSILVKIPEKLRVVFVMFELEEMSGEEIAAVLELPVGTVRSRLRLAREAFQREVRALGASEEVHGAFGEQGIPRMGGIG